ncbi:MAG: uroporphyrinogen decarboxylase [Chloroflexi bacterium]|nr:uroporphyrinogen decarboxylase [Chloroflexota bacterium]
MTDDLNNSRFLKAVRGEETDATPVWLMRQAGRYMVEYRTLREQHSILDIIKTPELAREVTLQPIEAFDLDAAIIFADILPPLEGMGLMLEFMKGEGPVLQPPVRDASDVDRLTTPPPEESLWFTLDAIKLTRQALNERGVPLIGFSGAPFTLASYAIEGGSSKHHIEVKRFMMGQNEAWHRLMGMLAEVVGSYLKAQAAAGAHVVQIFDSWVGALSPADYKTHVLPYTQRAVEIAREGGVPIIHFGTDTAGMLDLIKETGVDVIGVDWRIDLNKAWDIIGHDTPIMGNLDPVALFAPWENLKHRIQTVLDQAEGRPGHIFNLGHGILPQTPVDNVKRLVDFVHDYTNQ